MKDKQTVRCYVSGKVQGVWFRASTQECAQALSITGWVRNLSDKRVEVLATGDKENLVKFYEWLQKGPPLAQVKEVTYEELSLEEYDRFSIK